MADERNRWLDEAAADRLLRGEPVEPVGPAADPRAQARAARLRAALDSLAEPPPSAGAQLPGEAAALAAFRAARGPAAPAAGSPGVASGHEVPLVDLGRAVLPSVPRGRRSVRFGLAAALASVAVGGLAAAVGAGLLDRTRHDDAGPGPATSVSVDGEPAPSDSQDPTLSPNLLPSPLRDGAASPRTSGGPQTPGADGRTSAGPDLGVGGASSGAPATGGSGKDAQGGLTGGDGKDGRDTRDRDGRDPDKEGITGDGTGKDRNGDWETRLRNLDLCKDYRAGRLSDDRRDRLARLASGAARIPRYCESLLDGGAKGGTREGAPGEGGSGAGDGDVLRAPTLTPAQPGGSTGLLGRR
ncbi:hypothetical protein [Streptomyces xanthophaeus]|uniref:hypothetical protein n=1 Tax=Streptomyces xanthophaeus TaxID=67385 RepID=UPI0036684B08